MSSNQIIILSVFLGYLLFNVVVSFAYSKKAEKSLHTSEENKYFIGGRNMNGIVLAMTIMATYTSASSFISGPGAAGLTYGYAQAWIAAIQVPVTFLVLGVLGNKLALVSRRAGAVTVVGYFKARYKSDVLVIFTSFGLIAFFIAQMISQFTGGATLIASITGLDHVTSLLIFGTVVILYTAIGGFSAVVITDTIQGIVMCIGTFLFIFFVLKEGGGLAAIFLAAPMAAVMSTADSLLILATAAIVKDLWKNYVVKDDPVKNESYQKHVKLVSTILTMVLGAVVMVLTIDPPDIIFLLNMFAFGGLECTFFWPLVGGLFWKKGTKQAAVCSSIGAVATYIFATYNIHVGGINAVVWGLLVGAVLYFVIGAITGRKGLDADILDKCF